MIKRFTLLVLLAVAVIVVKAQQDPYYSHFMLNKTAYNPGAVGLKDICVNVLGHRQWMGFDEQSLEYKSNGQTLERRAVGPQTYFASVNAPLEKINSGVGIVFMSDALGYERTINVKAQYAYKIKNANGSFLQLGLDVGMLQKEFDGRYYNPRDPNDPLIPTGVSSGRKLDLGFGAYYANPNFYDLSVGVSATHLTGGSVQYQVANATENVAIARNIYIVASTSHALSNGIILQPNIWIKTIFSTTQVDLNCRALIEQKYIAGLTYRDGGRKGVLDAFSLQLGYYVKPNFYLGYAYDIPLTRGLAANGTHEIFASYCFKLPAPTPKPERWLIDQRYLNGYK